MKLLIVLLVQISEKINQIVLVQKDIMMMDLVLLVNNVIQDVLNVKNHKKIVQIVLPIENHILLIVSVSMDKSKFKVHVYLVISNVVPVKSLKKTVKFVKVTE